MNTEELHRLGVNLVKNFVGVFPIDRLPPLSQLPNESGFIVNTHTHNLPGEHWLAVWIGASKIYVFDPMGLYYPPLLSSYLHRSCKSVVYSKELIQQVNTKICGELSLIWLANRG